MRYEKFKKQHEAFQESGINDIALIFTILIRLFSIGLFLTLFLLPIILAFVSSWTMIFLLVLTWPFAGIIAWYIYDNRRHYILPGKFYYTPGRIRHLFLDTHPGDERCYYCRTRKADSRPYNLDLLKLKELKLKSGGYRYHSVNYINENISIHIPRSRKAFIVHALNVCIKITAILSGLIFLGMSSMVWRLVFGVITGGLISQVVLLLTRTRSNVSYLFSLSMILRFTAWVSCLILVSRFSWHPFDIRTSEAIYFAITAIVIFDSFIMQLIELVIGKNASKPVFRQFPEVHQKFREGYIVYNDIPVLSVVYPVFKWIFG
jgi:hypothetical protein